MWNHFLPIGAWAYQYGAVKINIGYEQVFAYESALLTQPPDSLNRVSLMQYPVYF